MTLTERNLNLKSLAEAMNCFHNAGPVCADQFRVTIKCSLILFHLKKAGAPACLRVGPLTRMLSSELVVNQIETLPKPSGMGRPHCC